MISAILLSPLARYAIAGATFVIIVMYSFFQGYSTGKNVTEREHKAALAESLQRGLEQAKDIARQDAEVSEYYERLRTKTITKVTEVTREIPANCAQCGIGSNGLRLINEARGHDSPAADAPVQPDGGLPATPQSGNGQDRGHSRALAPHEPRLLRLRGEASPVGATDQGPRGGA